MSEKKKHESDFHAAHDAHAAHDDVPADVVRDDVARAVSDSAVADVAGPQPPRPGDANYKTPELWGRGKANPAQVGSEPPDAEQAKHGQKHTKRQATEA